MVQGNAAQESDYQQLSKGLLFACSEGRYDDAKRLIDEGADITVSEEQGLTPLFFAAANGHLDIVKLLLENGHPWNLLSSDQLTAAEFAERMGHHEIYEYLLNEGVRAELLFRMMRKSLCPVQSEIENDDINEDACDIPPEEKETKPTNLDYLKQKLHYDDKGEKLLDEDENGVMMGWEDKLMKLHADKIAPREGLDVLNIGFGLGIIDAYLQKSKPSTHTIIEAHPDVYAHMLSKGWDKKPNVTILFGRWQEHLPKLEASGKQFDGIFFDTYAEYYDDLTDFHEFVPNILKCDGVYSYFNGLGATNDFFNEVYSRIVEMDLEGMGIKTDFEIVNMNELGDEVWDGVRRKYFTLDRYRLPVCKFMS
ncbi:S-adenosyl-L-methionine-dependent methyltransferase [Paraphysoderma sedebokerense]|nr:S-adenosyl-L-methionine-dependent methyltransferase [Paraphysoderma sedebokerense]